MVFDGLESVLGSGFEAVREEIDRKAMVENDCFWWSGTGVKVGFWSVQGRD